MKLLTKFNRNQPVWEIPTWILASRKTNNTLHSADKRWHRHRAIWDPARLQ